MPALLSLTTTLTHILGGIRPTQPILFLRMTGQISGLAIREIGIFGLTMKRMLTCSLVRAPGETQMSISRKEIPIKLL